VEPPRSAIGQIATGVAFLGGAAWVGAALNSRAVAQKSPAAATAAAALGAVTGSLVALFGAATLSVTEGKWKTLGQTTTILGVGGFTALALVGLKINDRMLAQSASQPQALLASEADSGGSFALHVGDTLTVELPAAQAGYKWSWTSTAGPLTGPASVAVAVTGGSVEHDTWTAVAAGDAELTAQLVPTSGGASIATWNTSVTVA
jgi:hypothetical protein